MEPREGDRGEGQTWLMRRAKNAFVLLPPHLIPPVQIHRRQTKTAKGNLEGWRMPSKQRASTAFILYSKGGVQAAKLMLIPVQNCNEDEAQIATPRLAGRIDMPSVHPKLYRSLQGKKMVHQWSVRSFLTSCLTDVLYLCGFKLSGLLEPSDPRVPSS